MSRRTVSKKRFPESDPIYNSYLVSLLITRILKCGKKLRNCIITFCIFVTD